MRGDQKLRDTFQPLRTDVETMLPKPTVSVLCAIYNAGPFIDGLMETLLNQRYTRWEAILVNDGSTDDTAQRIRPYLRDARFVYLEQKNSGLSASRNNALAVARGEWITVLDHDDRWLPEKLEQQLAFAEENRLDLLGTGVTVVQANSRRPYAAFFPPAYIEQLKMNGTNSEELFSLLLRYNFLCASSVMLKKELFAKVGLFDARAIPADDYDMWLRCAQVARLGYFDRPLTEYAIHDGNMSHNFVKMNVKTIFALENAVVRLRHDKARLRLLSDTLIPIYQHLFTLHLLDRDYRAGFRLLKDLATRGTTGLRRIRWIFNRDFRNGLRAARVNRGAIRRSIFGEQNLDEAKRQK